MLLLLRARRSGISLLLEAVVGFGLLATSMLLLFALFPTSYTTLAVAKDRSLALQLARENIEMLRVAGFADPMTNVGSNSAPVILPTIINGNRTEQEFTITNTIVADGDTVKRIRVEVRWSVGAAGSATGLERNVSLETYVTEH